MADTLDKKELKKLADELIQLKGRKPETVTKIVLKPVDTIKKTDQISFKKDTISIIDYYPDKNNFFIKYENRISLLDTVGKSSFKLKPFNLDIVISENNGIFEADINIPDFIELNDVSIQSQPKEKLKKDFFGFIVGADYRSDRSVELNSYIRWKKLYFGGGIDNRGIWKTGVKIEF